MRTPLSRRSFLHNTRASGLGLAIIATGTGTAHAATRTGSTSAAGTAASPGTTAGATGTDDFATVRAQWANIFTGGRIDATASVYVTALSTLETQITGFLASYTASGSQLFSDLTLGTNSANVSNSLTRLETMALGYLTPGTSYSGNAALLQDVIAGLDFMVGGPYAPDVKPYGSWWDWQIGSSQPLVDTANLVYSSLSATQIANYCASVDAFVPDPTKQLIVNYGYTTSTGANRLDECRAVIIRGALAR